MARPSLSLTPKILATSSVVALFKNGDHLVDQAAKCQAIANSENTVFSAKCLINFEIGKKRRHFSTANGRNMTTPWYAFYATVKASKFRPLWHLLMLRHR
ncbi:MAG: Hsp70 family protein [Puniceicoccales bacterium]|nr:Hsp70 family protein [Puniceicoccales bacterium]